MRTEFLPLFLAGLMASGCSGDFYSATSTKDGVIILNKLTGTVRQVKDDVLFDLPEGHIQPPPISPQPHKPIFAPQGIPKQPFTIGASAKYRNAMLLKLTIEPDDVPKTPDQWRAWREHLSAVRINSSLHLEFLDADGFIIDTHDVALLSLRQTVDLEGEIIGIEDQISVPMTAEEYSQVTHWQVGWAGFTKDFKAGVN